MGDRCDHCRTSKGRYQWKRRSLCAECFEQITGTTPPATLDNSYVYQLGYLEVFEQYQFDTERQYQKAGKTLCVLSDYYGAPESLKELSLLDVGCSAGLMTRQYAEEFKSVVGIDIDEPAVTHAVRNYASDNLRFLVRDSMDTDLDSESFDVVTCAHIYEHVPDSHRLMSEIFRVLKKGGVCYFAAQNRLSFIEPHYGLPLLSIIPKPWANTYLRLMRKGDYYYENLLTLRGLKRLVSSFRLVDYTMEVIRNPVRYSATELLQPGSLKQKVALAAATSAYFLCPTYIWLLVKE